MNFNNFNSFLNSKQLYLDDLTTSIVYSAIVNKAPIMFRGPAGTGKTNITKIIAEFLGAKYIFYQCTVGTTEDDLIYKILPSESTKSGVQLVLGPLPEALKISQKTKVVLVLDEFDKTRPSVDALLLDFLQNYRVSVRIGSERIIKGNPDNLIVLITSNDERDFSEPLLRRVVSVKLNHLKPEFVRKKLKLQGFSDEVTKLLVQLYKDTINANLRKPATIQELIQLGKAIDLLGDQADWTSLVHSYVIKDGLDWQRYTEYLKAGRSSEYNDYSNYTEDEDITGYYEESDETVSENKDDRKPKMPKINITVKPESNTNEKEVAMYMEFNEENYDRVIKDFEPEPTDHPAIFADFKVIKDDEKALIIKEKPLSFRDVITSCKINKVKVKEVFDKPVTAYIKQRIRLAKFIKDFIKLFKVMYYSTDLLRFKYGTCDFILKKVKEYPYWSEWDLELIFQSEYYHSRGDLVYVINQIMEYSPEYIYSELFTKEVKNLAEKCVINVDADSSWEANEKAKKSDAYKELQEKIDKLRSEYTSKYSIEIFITDSVNVSVIYNGRDRLVRVRDDETDKFNELLSSLKWLPSLN